MKTFLTIVAVSLMSGLAGAADFAGLQGLNAAGIPKVNPFPNPGNPDSCYLTGLKDGLCNFKCLSGETFSVKPVNPEAASVYEKCGGGDYRGAGKAAPALQTYKSYGRYPTFEKASAALTWAANDLKLAKIQVVSQKIVVYGLSDYRYELAFNSARPLAIEPSPSYQRELDAYERMFDAAARLEGRGAVVVIQEVREDAPGSYSFSIGFFPGSSDKGITVNIGKEQAFNSYGSYATESQARAQLDTVAKGLNALKGTKVLDYRTVKNSLISYSFEVKFRSIQTLGVYRHDAVYRTEEEAAEAMAGMAESLSKEKKNVVALETTREGFNKYSFTVAYLSLELNIPFPVLKGGDKTACFISGLQGNTCVYKCSNGTTYTMPAQRPSPADEFQVACPQFVFPF